MGPGDVTSADGRPMAIDPDDVEAIALRPKFAPLFTREQLATARERLKKLGYDMPESSEPPKSGGFGRSYGASDDASDRSPVDDSAPSERPVGRSTEGEHEIHFAPNLIALKILKQVRDRQNGRRETDPSRTQELIREARDGGMYGRQHPG